jgi:hypothetical protein
MFLEDVDEQDFNSECRTCWFLSDFCCSKFQDNVLERKISGEHGNIWTLMAEIKHDFLSYSAVQEIAIQCSYVEFPYFIMGHTWANGKYHTNFNNSQFEMLKLST